MNIWHAMNPNRVNAHEFDAVVEITKGSQNKYELDKETGLIKLDRVLFTSTHYPHNYGFIPLTYAGDDDPLDVLIICSQPLDPMTIVTCRPIGLFSMLDKGQEDEKIIAIAVHDPTYMDIYSIEQLQPHLFDEIRHFFGVYKALEGGKRTVVHHMEGNEEAIAVVQQSINRYKRIFGKEEK